jgi:hypothetical protein
MVIEATTTNLSQSADHAATVSISGRMIAVARNSSDMIAW